MTTNRRFLEDWERRYRAAKERRRERFARPLEPAEAVEDEGERRKVEDEGERRKVEELVARIDAAFGDA